MKKKKLIIWGIVLLFIIGICVGMYYNRDKSEFIKRIFAAAYGMSSDVEKLENQEIIKYAEKFNVPYNDLYQLDTAYSSFLTSLRKDTIFDDIIKNHYQPLQAMYFDKDGKLISYYINCYTDPGLFNLKWDINNSFAVFPPAHQDGLEPDTLFNYFKFNHLFKPLSKKESIDEKQYDNYVVVFWTAFLGRQSKRLIDIVQKNRKLSTGNVKYFFVNIDNYFYYDVFKQGSSNPEE
ncbi:MAG: hypothetical protein FWD66_00465 [Paludibacter sp.]|nr:hypothetical protein [Paludibacter sp.]